MFTGIIERTGLVRAVRSQPGGRRVAIELGPMADELAVGDSIAVNGACLTVAAVDPPVAEFDIITETLHRTNLGQLQAGHRVNLERPLVLGARLDGYLVQGHVDATATLVDRQTVGGQFVLWFQTDEPTMAYITPKGAVTVDGVALTVVEIDRQRFSTALIPTTLERTTLGDRRVGDRVNIETDLIARIVARQLEVRAERGTLTAAKLRELGFA